MIQLLYLTAIRLPCRKDVNKLIDCVLSVRAPGQIQLAMTTPMQCDNCSTSRKLRLVSELFSAVSRTQPVRRRTLSQLRTEFLADRPAPWQRRLCSSELSAGTSATTPVSTLDKARSSLLDGLSLGQHSTARAQHSKFSSPEDLSHDPQNTPSKFHRRSPSGVRDLGF